MCSNCESECVVYGENEWDQNKHVLYDLMWVLTWFLTQFTVAAATSKKKKKKKMACKFMESLSTSVILPNEPHSCTSGEMILQQCWLLDTLQVIMWSICCCLGSDAWTPNKQQVSVYGHRSPMVYDRFGVLSTAEGDKIKTCFLGRV